MLMYMLMLSPIILKVPSGERFQMERTIQDQSLLSFNLVLTLGKLLAQFGALKTNLVERIGTSPRAFPPSAFNALIFQSSQ